MIEAKDDKVHMFLKDISMLSPEKYEVLQELRELVYKIYPNVIERIIYGGIMFSIKEDFGGIFVRKNHISFEFGYGYLMEDPKKLLEGSGKNRRHLKLLAFSDILDKNLEYYIKQAYIKE